MCIKSVSLLLLFAGTYIPRKEVEVVETIQATIIRPNQAIRIQARKECKDREGNKRVTGILAVPPRVL